MIPLFKPYMPKLPELEEILQSGKLAGGIYTNAFEECLKKYFGQTYLLVTNTFASAISVMATVLGLSFGDEVIASPMGCLVSTQPYAAMGLKIKWCDVDPRKGTLSPDALRNVISCNTKAIIHNHFCGYPGYIDEINSIAKEFGVPVIHDGIECFGSEYKGKKVGSCDSNVAVFSLSAVRLPNTIDGGVLIFKDEQQYKKAIRVRDCGIDRSRFRDDIGEIDPRCDISEIGYSAVMSNVNGYIGLKQMEKVDELIGLQRENAKKWDRYFDGAKDISLVCTKDINPNYWVYGIFSEHKRETILKFRELGYYASGVHINNNIYSVFGERTKLLGVNEFYNKFVALPCGWWMGECKQ